MTRTATRIEQVLLCVAGLSVALLPRSAQAEEMPKDFVYLRDIDASIQQDMRYAGSNNFTGAPVPGYDAAECVLVREAAQALKTTQAELRPKGLSLKVYDCYRPTRAVAAFVAWAKRPDDPKARAVHYPALQKSVLFPDYIATRSGHSRGATVDLTLVPLGSPLVAAQEIEAACTAPQNERGADNSLDMGTGFDCFDVKAHTATPGLTTAQRRGREALVGVMRRHGFKNYPNEWWHYTFQPEPYPDTYFDFSIEPRARGKE